MKKKYIAPESRLFVLNIRENIAGSDSIFDGQDQIESNVVIRFTVDTDPCRMNYTDCETAPVRVTGTAFKDYYGDLMEYGSTNPMVYYNCFRHVGWL
ncbi:MAG: hypothetical protein IJO03_08310 [Clostridia bacterium]|nr:hypothetical protein [Clostridia bacterium]MBQ7122245.1 hypothetical protein [Clostridia bacterium]